MTHTPFANRRVLLVFPVLFMASAAIAQATVPAYTEVKNGMPRSLAGQANMLDVTNLPAAVLTNGVVNAVPDDGIDDTPAIRAAIAYALSDRPNYNRNGSPQFVYFPTGTYRITSEIQSRIDDGTPNSWADGWRRGMYLLGESRTGTILKLDDNLAAYQDAASPKAVIKTGSESDDSTNEAGGGNRAFDHSIMNMTVDTGSGNAGAIGIDYIANNTGTIEDVTVRTSDALKKGAVGIEMSRNWPGPALIKNVEVDGFDCGVRVDNHYVYGMTFEHLTIKNQRVLGIKTRNNPLHMRGLTSVNSVPVFESTGNRGALTLVDADLSGPSSFLRCSASATTRRACSALTDFDSVSR